ncbi:MAG: GIY-YIG nuclease family protein [Nitrospinae bacterium]|nr:GIY-YIG nuclease family protein [Nitrospinota bacterium]
MAGTPGLYLIFMELGKDKEIKVGKLGCFAFPSGHYSYTGSAMGGLEARLARHRRGAKRLFWHIDYLLQWARIVDIRTFPFPERLEEQSTPLTPRLECRLNQIVLGHPKAQVLVPGFGSSDCHCPSHLAYYLEGIGFSFSDRIYGKVLSFRF